MQETGVWSLGQEDPLEEEMLTHSSILACEIPWTEELGGLQVHGGHRVIHSWGTEHTPTHMPQWVMQLTLKRILMPRTVSSCYLPRSFLNLPLFSFLLMNLLLIPTDQHILFKSMEADILIKCSDVSILQERANKINNKSISIIEWTRWHFIFIF